MSNSQKTKEDWMEEDWVVARMDSGPEKGFSTKKEAVKYAANSCLRRIKEMKTRKLHSGVYITTPKNFESTPGPDGHVSTQPEYWIFRPEALEEYGSGTYMLDPSHYE